MWPWEHAALGYVVLSVVSRVLWRRPPGDAMTLAVLLGTQFPDLLDKPLGWVFEVFPSGISVGHSVFVASGVCLAVTTLGVRSDRPRVALAFSLGYLSHLPADIVYPALTGGRMHVSILLWPFVVSDARGGTPALSFARSLFDNFLALLFADPGVSGFLVLEVLFLGGAVAVWLFDGRPGLPPFRRHRTRPS